MLSIICFGQSFSQVNLTPNGVLDNVFDRYGNQYRLSDLLISNQSSNSPLKSTLVICSTTSYYNLYFEPGCGMEDVNNQVHNNRRAVVCKVFEDLSNFINSPLTASGNKVNIWIRNINNVPNSNPSGLLGVGTGFYQLPNNSTNGGISDNEVWKTIHRGIDSYQNTTVPFVASGTPNQTGSFYHGMVAFNFNDTANPPIPNPQTINWNTNLTSTTIPFNFFDLYSVVLHEAVHALGFSSLIDADGGSKFPANYEYYERYDTMLKTNSGISILTNNGACSTMYNYIFNNTLNNSVLHPNTSNCITDVTSCNQAVRFFTSSTVSIPVYTPNCFEPQSSLSHFEDGLFPNCNTPNGDDNYFLMCNAGNSGVIRRFLKSEERIALCRIGYSVKTTYGSSNVFQSYINYGGSVCTGIAVAGSNDGIQSNGSYTFTPQQNQQITIPASILLGNDLNATGYQCLQDLSEINGFPTTLTGINGTATTNITFSSNLSGIHVLRYVPTNGSLRGNITYVYIYVQPNTTNLSCNPIFSSCNLIGNGSFEENNSFLTQPNNMQFERVCGWYGTLNQTPFYFTTNSFDNTRNVPCNLFGLQTDNVLNNDAYAGIFTTQFNDGTTIGGMLGTTLNNPLTPGANYQLKFDVSLSEFVNHRFSRLQAFVTNTAPNSITGLVIPDAMLSSGVLLNSSTISNRTNGWETIVINFTAPAGMTGLNRLFIGGLNNFEMINGANPLSAPSCADNFTLQGQNGAFYYIDNVSLLPTNGAVFDLPATMCRTEIIANLATFLSTNTTPNGIFSGPGVTYNSLTQIYSLQAVSGVNTATINYTYTSSNNCPVTLTDNIVVLRPLTPLFPNIPVICQGGAVPILPTLSDNGVTGTWNPPTINNNISGTYIFTPSPNQCATTRSVAVKVLPNNAFVANNDSFIAYVSANATTTNSVLLNDTYNGGSIPPTIPNIPYYIVPTGSVPNFITGGIIFDTITGSFTILPNTPTGTYIYNYFIKNNCFDTPIATVTIVVAGYFAGFPRKNFNFCFNNNSVSSSTGSFNSTGVSLYDGFTIQGQPINGNNVHVEIVSPAPPTPLPIPITINIDGTFTIPQGTLPGGMNFYYKICENNSANCSEDILCDINVKSTFLAHVDFVTATPNGAITYNVLSNDVLFNCPTSYSPLSLSNVTLTPMLNAMPFYFINPFGKIINNSQFPPTGTYLLQYKLCDNLYPAICQTVDVYLTVPTMRLDGSIHDDFDIEKIIISPNPSDGRFTIYFNTMVSEAQFALYNYLGQKVYSESFYDVKNKDLIFSDLTKGLYCLRITTANKTINRQIILK